MVAIAVPHVYSTLRRVRHFLVGLVVAVRVLEGQV